MVAHSTRTSYYKSLVMYLFDKFGNSGTVSTNDSLFE